MEKKSVKSFYGNKTYVSRFTLLGSAVEDAVSSTTKEPTIAIIGPPIGGDESENEDFDDDEISADAYPDMWKRIREVSI